jgi:hypothetical protein
MLKYAYPSLPSLDLELEWRAEYLGGRRRSQVVSATGEEVFFKIKRNTKLSKLQGAYANKVGKDVGSIRCVSFSFPFFFFLFVLSGVFTFVRYLFSTTKTHQSRGYVDTNSETFDVTGKIGFCTMEIESSTTIRLQRWTWTMGVCPFPSVISSLSVKLKSNATDTIDVMVERTSYIASSFRSRR